MSQLRSADYETIVANELGAFGARVGAKVWHGVGSQEDHLRGPLEQFMRAVGKGMGLSVVLLGETRLESLGVRPDYAVNVAGARTGYIELKKPGTGVPGLWKPSRHDREQWEKLGLLPNVLYTDGIHWAVYQSGELSGSIARVGPNLQGGRLRVMDGDLGNVLGNFLLWSPERPRTLNDLVRAVAGLCQLLRREVADVLSQREATSERHLFSELANDWRGLLFPRLTDQEFADAYAQTVTFALLLARVEGVEFEGSHVAEIARLLGKKHSLMGKALSVLTEEALEGRSIVVDTLARVIGAVHWEDFADNAYAHIYERFLEVYDPALRKQSGSYYTPPQVVNAMTELVNQVLLGALKRPLGFASDDVIVVDPAMGTGSYLGAIIDSVAETVRRNEGPGQVAPRLRKLSERLIGFEKQAAPYAVAQLRVHSTLKAKYGAEVPDTDMRFLADALDDPYLQEIEFGRTYEAIAKSRRGANKVKRESPVMVVIGNPPYREKARGLGSWLEARGGNGRDRPNLDAFRAVGRGKYEYVLSNLYVYFWRWATWKVFDVNRDELRPGVVAFITPAAYTTGPGFAGMREYLRRTADFGWVIDLSPEGHQPSVGSRIFPETQHEICVSIYARSGKYDPDTPAHIKYLSIPGSQAEKFAALSGTKLGVGAWLDCQTGWGDPIIPERQGPWSQFLAVGDIAPWSAPGVKPNRTWVYAPEMDTLRKRWDWLVSAPVEEKAALFRESRDANLSRVPPPLAGQPAQAKPFAEERGRFPGAARIAYRSFDRQWIIPDARLLHAPSPDLWRAHGPSQIYMSEQHSHPITTGPGLTFAAHPPDMDHYMGHGGGRVLPLYRDAAAKLPNLPDGLLTHLSHCFKFAVTPEDVFSYIACLASNRSYTERFREDLSDPGVRIPFTRSSQLWRDAVRVGRSVIWLHTYGERFADPVARRSPVGSRASGQRPMVTAEISDSPGDMPNFIDYDDDTKSLLIGAGGRIHPVSREAWMYELSGVRVIRKWFGYRKQTPASRRTSALNDIRAECWTPAMTGELLDLLNVLEGCLRVEERQVELLDAIVEGEVIASKEMMEAQILPPSALARRPLRRDRAGGLWSE